MKRSILTLLLPLIIFLSCSDRSFATTITGGTCDGWPANPVPEPSALLLLGAGIAAFLLASQRKRMATGRY